MKLISGIGKFIKIDRVMVMKEIFSYVRILVEMFIEKELLKEIFFENE